MRNVIVTGTGGFVGARAAQYFNENSNVITLPSGFLAEADENSVREFLMRNNPDVIVHCAAISDVRDCEKAPEASYRANVELPQWIAKAARECKSKLICFSSDQVYTGLKPDVYTEDTPLAPANVYGRHKLEMENRVLDILPESIMLRATWMYDFPAYKLPIHGNMLLIMLAAAASGKRCAFAPNEMRGITYVRQVTENLEKVIEIPGGVYNYGSENPMDMYSTALDFADALNLHVDVEKLICEPQSLAFSISKLKAAGVDFDTTSQGIRRCAADYNIQWLCQK